MRQKEAGKERNNNARRAKRTGKVVCNSRPSVVVVKSRSKWKVSNSKWNDVKRKSTWLFDESTRRKRIEIDLLPTPSMHTDRPAESGDISKHNERHQFAGSAGSDALFDRKKHRQCDANCVVRATGLYSNRLWMTYRNKVVVNNNANSMGKGRQRKKRCGADRHRNGIGFNQKENGGVSR